MPRFWRGIGGFSAAILFFGSAAAARFQCTQVPHQRLKAGQGVGDKLRFAA
jgi:hypothetical protein